MHNYAKLCKTMHATGPILITSFYLNIRKVHVKFLVVVFEKKWLKKRNNVENRYLMHNHAYAKLYTQMTRSFSLLLAILRRMCVKFQSNHFSSFLKN